jgi:hypothetical protein
MRKVDEGRLRHNREAGVSWLEIEAYTISSFPSGVWDLDSDGFSETFVVKVARIPWHLSLLGFLRLSR